MRPGQVIAAVLALATPACASRPRARPAHVQPLRCLGPPAPSARDASVVRVATFNVHRYFDTVCDSGRCGPRDWEALPSPEGFARRAGELADAVRRLDADVVLLQEVESERALHAVRDRLGGEFPTAVLGAAGPPGSINTAVLARDRLVAARAHRAQPSAGRPVFAREFLEVRLDRGGRAVVVFCAHFRSKVRDDPDRREAEARAARDVVTAAARELPGALVVMGGDLNDTPGSRTLEALEAGGGLARVAAELPPAEQATYPTWDGPAALDHLYVPAALGDRYVRGSARVLCDAPTPRGDGGFAGSDHAALRADFILR